MNKRLADLVGKARQLESAIESRIEGVSRQLSTSPRQPIEIVHAIVQAVAGEVQAAGRGRQVFPYTQLRVTLAASSPRERARLEAALDGPPSLQDRLIERLTAAGCAVPSLQVKITFVTQAKTDWPAPEFGIDYARSVPAAVEPPAASRIELAVAAGTAERSSYTLPGPTIAIGRGVEVRDSRERLIRTNHVAFVERSGEVNQSVSRQHAHIEHDPATHTFRLHDDGAAHGTSVIRDGRGLPVPRGRGLRLRSGDVIVLGQARIKVRVLESSR